MHYFVKTGTWHFVVHQSKAKLGKQRGRRAEEGEQGGGVMVEMG